MPSKTQPPPPPPEVEASKSIASELRNAPEGDIAAHCVAFLSAAHSTEFENAVVVNSIPELVIDALKHATGPLRVHLIHLYAKLASFPTEVGLGVTHGEGPVIVWRSLLQALEEREAQMAAEEAEEADLGATKGGKKDDKKGKAKGNEGPPPVEAFSPGGIDAHLRGLSTSCMRCTGCLDDVAAEGLPAFVTLCEHATPLVRSRAWQLLTTLARRRALSTAFLRAGIPAMLIERAGSPDLDVSVAALEAARELWNTSPPCRIALLDLGLPALLAKIVSAGPQEPSEAPLTAALEALQSVCMLSMSAVRMIHMRGGVTVLRALLPAPANPNAPPADAVREEASEPPGKAPPEPKASERSDKKSKESASQAEKADSKLEMSLTTADGAAAAEDSTLEEERPLPLPQRPAESPCTWAGALRVLAALMRVAACRKDALEREPEPDTGPGGDFEDMATSEADNQRGAMKLAEEQATRVAPGGDASPTPPPAARPTPDPAALTAAAPTPPPLPQPSLILHMLWLLRQTPESSPDKGDDLSSTAKTNKAPAPAKNKSKLDQAEVVTVSPAPPFSNGVQMSAAECLQALALDRQGADMIARAKAFHELLAGLEHIPNLLLAERVAALLGAIGSHVPPKTLDETLSAATRVMQLAKRAANTELSLLKNTIGRVVMAHRPEYPTRPPLPSPPPSPPGAPPATHLSVWDTLADGHLASGIAQHS